jgi:hypothetical protein
MHLISWTRHRGSEQPGYLHILLFTDSPLLSPFSRLFLYSLHHHVLKTIPCPVSKESSFIHDQLIGSKHGPLYRLSCYTPPGSRDLLISADASFILRQVLDKFYFLLTLFLHTARLSVNCFCRRFFCTPTGLLVLNPDKGVCADPVERGAILEVEGPVPQAGTVSVS